MTIQQMFFGISGALGYLLQRSVRLRSSASAYFNRTPASATNRKTWTWSGWVKRGILGSGSEQALFTAGNQPANTYDTFTWLSDLIRFTVINAAAQRILVTTQSVFRDPSAWYHVVIAIDTTQAVSTNGVRIWVNNVLQPLTVTAYTQNQDCTINSTSPHYIGVLGGYAPSYFDGYLAEVNFIDGQALTPTSFGEFNTITGVWQPIKYAGTYGTNGFYLNFQDNSGATATTIGKDSSGNGNNWTPNNISVTAGITYDSMTDVPTLTSATQSNFATLNSLNIFSVNIAAGAVSNGNLRTQSAASVNAYQYLGSTISVQSGAYYFESTISQVASSIFPTAAVGWAINNTSSALPATYVQVQLYTGSGSTILVNGTTVQSGLGTITNGDIIGIAFDATNLTCQFYKNGATLGTQVTGITSGSYQATVAPVSNGSAATAIIDVNFGQRPFAYTPPTGFVALNSFNLLDNTITNGSNQFAATLWTGNGSNPRNITGLNFQPDFVWVKARNAGVSNLLNDSVRGFGTTKNLQSNTTSAEGAGGANGAVSAALSNGFTVAAGATDSANVNNNTVTYVGWSWKGGGTAVTNTSGSTSSQVSANPTAGFSVVTWTQAAPAATIGHGLGVAPKLIIVKQRNVVNSWYVNSSLLTGGNDFALILNATSAAANTANIWNNTAATSSVFSIGTAWGAGTMVAYCFAEIPGYSKFGSYIGNGSTDGRFVYLGFRPRWLLIKRTDSTGGWNLYDSTRNPYNVADLILQPNNSNAEASGITFPSAIDFLSNGFKTRNYDATYGPNINANGGTYIYMAFAENPFKNALAR
jgi:hypothetical protein